MGGVMQGRLWPRNESERKETIDKGYDLDAVLTIEDLVSGDSCFFATTGITDGGCSKVCITPEARFIPNHWLCGLSLEL